MNFLEVNIISINREQIRQIQAIFSDYENFQCLESAQAVQEYLINQGIKGKRIKIYTGTAMGWDANIYDDLLGSAISVNGRHEGISITINGVDIVYDNLHPKGLPRNQ